MSISRVHRYGDSFTIQAPDNRTIGVVSVKNNCPGYSLSISDQRTPGHPCPKVMSGDYERQELLALAEKIAKNLAKDYDACGPKSTRDLGEITESALESS